MIRAAPRGDADNTYQAGVKAAMDMVRRFGIPYADTGTDDGEGMSANE